MRAVAVPYVIALILGVAVIGLVGYWFATSGGKFGGQSSKTICDNKFLQYCVTNPGVTFSAYAPECTGLVSYADCKELTGAGGGVAGGGGGVALLGSCSEAACQTGLTCCDSGSTCAKKDNICRKSTGSCSSNNECTDDGCNAPQGGGSSVC